MPIFPEARVVFIHIPKCAGSSVEDYLFAKYKSKRNSANYWMNPRVNNHTRQHCSVTEMESSVPNFWRNLILCIVRNPFHRVVSEVLWIRWFIMRQKDAPSRQQVNEDVVHFLTKNNSRGSPGGLRTHADADVHRKPQHEFLQSSSSDASILPDPRILILKQEELERQMWEAGFPDFCGNSHRKMSRAFKGKQIDFTYDDVLTLETRQIVYEFYKKDFELFYPNLKTITR